jgi:hypothetical protein
VDRQRLDADPDRIRIRIGIKMEIRIRIGSKRSTRSGSDPDWHQNGKSDPDRLNTIHKAGGEVTIYPAWHKPATFGTSRLICVQINKDIFVDLSFS